MRFIGGKSVAPCYVAIRCTGGNEWIDPDTFARFRDMAMNKAEAFDTTFPMIAKNSPVVGVIAVNVEAAI